MSSTSTADKDKESEPVRSFQAHCYDDDPWLEYSPHNDAQINCCISVFYVLFLIKTLFFSVLHTVCVIIIFLLWWGWAFFQNYTHTHTDTRTHTDTHTHTD